MSIVPVANALPVTACESVKRASDSAPAPSDPLTSARPSRVARRRCRRGCPWVAAVVSIPLPVMSVRLSSRRASMTPRAVEPGGERHHWRPVREAARVSPDRGCWGYGTEGTAVPVPWSREHDSCAELRCPRRAAVGQAAAPAATVAARRRHQSDSATTSTPSARAALTRSRSSVASCPPTSAASCR